MTGFTGVVWQARPAEKLAADLVAGAGPAPLAEAGAAWIALSAAITEAGADYVKILAKLGAHWESAVSDEAFNKLATLAGWFAGAATEAAQIGARVEAQAAATTVAVLTMPNLAELAVTAAIRDAAESLGGALGGAAIGAAANAERAQHDQLNRASRVMETFEVASVDLARPWKTTPPREVVSSAALDAEQALAREAARQAASVSGAVPPTVTAGGVPAGHPVGVTPQREKTAYAATTLAASTTSAGMKDAGPAASAPARPVSATPPIAPMASPAATVNTVNSAPRPAPVKAVASDEDDELRRWTDSVPGRVDAADRDDVEPPESGRPVDPRYVDERLTLSTQDT